jgi:hypothetical protein
MKDESDVDVNLVTWLFLKPVGQVQLSVGDESSLAAHKVWQPELMLNWRQIPTKQL